MFSFFEKIRRNAQKCRYSGNEFDDALGSLIESIYANSNETNNRKSQRDIFLVQLKKYIEISSTNSINNSIRTANGRIVFDFSRQMIDEQIYLQLMQFVRLSNLDRVIEQIFHKSGNLICRISFSKRKFNISRRISRYRI